MHFVKGVFAQMYFIFTHVLKMIEKSKIQKSG